MERLQRLILSKDSEVTTDGQTDSTSHTSERNTFSTSSSPCDSTYLSISSVLDWFNLDGSSHSLSSGETNVNVVVKPSFSNVHELDRFARLSQGLKRSYLYWSLNENSEEFSSIESSRASILATDIISLLFRGSDKTSTTFTTAVSLVPTATSQELTTPYCTTSFASNDGINIRHVTILSQLFPAYFNFAPSLTDNINEKLQDLTPALFDGSGATVIHYTHIDVNSQTDLSTSIYNQFISDQGDNENNKNILHLRITSAVYMLESSLVSLVSRIRADQSAIYLALSSTEASNSHLLLGHSANDKLSTEFWNFESVALSSYKIYHCPFITVKTKLSLSEVHDNKKNVESPATFQLTQTNSRLSEIKPTATLAGFSDIASSLTTESSHISSSGVEITGSYPDHTSTSVNFSPCKSLNSVSNEDIVEEDWLYCSQTASTTIYETLQPAKTNTLTQNVDILSFHLILPSSYQIVSRQDKPSSSCYPATSFTSAASDHFISVPALLSATGSNTNPNYTVNSTFNKFSTVGSTDDKQHAKVAILTTSPISLDFSIVNEVQTDAETADSFIGEVTHKSFASASSNHFYPLTMEAGTTLSTYLQSSLTLKHDSVFHNPNMNVYNEIVSVFDDSLEKTLNYQFPPAPSTLSSAVPHAPSSEGTTSQTMYSAQAIDTISKVLETSECSGIFCSPQRPTTLDYVSSTVNATYKTTATDGGTSSKQMPHFNTTIIIASACAVLALVILVVIALFCLRRKNKTNSPPSRHQGDNLWVDLYRSNSTHQLPLPSLTTCASTFEMVEVLKPDVNQEKVQRQVTSFQIKKPQPEAEQELGLTYPGAELEVTAGLDHAEYWANVSITSLPMTDVSYVTNVTDYTMAAVGHKFRVVYAYKPVCKGEMALKEGELLVCKERDRNGWMFGSKPRTNEEGWFPAVYVDEISSEDELDLSYDIPETYDILESNKLHNADQYWTGIEHRVCYRYESPVPGDLIIDAGQSVIVLQTLANGWWFGTNASRCGWFPGSYVELIVDNSKPEQPSTSDKQCDELNISVKSQSTTEDNTTTQSKEVRTKSDNKSVSEISQLWGSEEITEKDFAKKLEAHEKALHSESSNTNVQIQQNSSPAHAKDALVEPMSGPDITTKSKATLTPCRQAPDKPETASISTNHKNSLSLTRKSTHDHKLGKSLRPARPAPPPPKRKDSQIIKYNILSTEPSSYIQTDRAQATVLKKQVALIHGKKPKLHKVLRSMLDEKQLNPMIRPSTRGFMPKPTENAENSHYNTRNKYNLVELGHTNLNPSIADDLHSELMILIGQPHETIDHLSPSHAFNFRRLSQNDGSLSSKTSLEFDSDSRLASPGNVSQQLNMKENSTNTEHSELKFSKTFLSHRERSLTPDSKRERSITPDYKREKSNSPILLTTGNLLQNVQRFHGALRHSSPSPSVDTDKLIIKELYAEAGSGPIFNIARSGQRAPTNISPPKLPSMQSSQNGSLTSAKQKHKSSQSPHTAMVNLEYSNEPENLTNQSIQPINIDNNSNCDITDVKKQSNRLIKPDNSVLNQDSLVVTPGTVSEIVHQINNQSPLQNELL